jgi:hypothetical protein
MVEVQKKEITLPGIIQQMSDANEGTASACYRLSTIVDQLLVGAPPCATGPSGNTGTNAPTSQPGALTLLADHAENHFEANRRLDDLLCKLENIIR